MAIQTTLPTVAQREESNVLALRFFDTNHRPSWKRFGEGTAEMRATLARDGNHVSFHVSEYAKPETKDGRGSSKEAMLTLDRKAAFALYEALHDVYGQWPDQRLRLLEIECRKQPWTEMSSDATGVDKISAKFCRSFSVGDRFRYYHNGVEITRDRAVDLLVYPALEDGQ